MRLDKLTFIVLLVAVCALGAAPLFAGCYTTRTLPDGTVLKEPDLASTKAGIELAITALDRIEAAYDKYHPQATPEEKAAALAAKNAEKARLQKLLDDLVTGAITPGFAQKSIAAPALK